MNQMDDVSCIRRPVALAQILQRTAELGIDMASEDRAGALLRALVASKPAGRFLELGTGTGVAAAWILDGMDAASTFVSVDVNATFQQVVRDVLGGDPRLTLLVDDALAFLEQQAPSTFDMVFADALRGKYEGLDLALRVVKPSGFYVIDDMLPQPNWPHGHASRVEELLKSLPARDDFEVAPMAWASGLVVAVRK